MKLSDIVPEKVMNEISLHIKEKTQQAEKNYPNNWGDENTITGSLFSPLKTEWKSCGNCKWMIDYQRSRQSAVNTFNEKETGADGTISINVECKGKTYTKYILFQSKIKENIKSNELNEQIKKMNKDSGSDNMVIVYSDEGFYAQTADINKFNKENKTKFDDYLKDDFFACRSGCWGKSNYISDQSHCLTISVKDE